MKNTMTEFEKYVREKFEVKEFESVEDEDLFMFLLNGPLHYRNEDKMLAYAQAHPDATMKELSDYWGSITPPGLAPGDDGEDLQEEDKDDD